MCLLRPCRNATIWGIVVLLRIRVWIYAVVVYMRPLSEEMSRQYRGGRIKSSIFSILFTICEVCLFVSIVLAHQGKRYRSAVYGVIAMMCGTPFLGRTWGLRD